MGQRKLVTEILSNIAGGHEVAAAHLGLTIAQFRDRLYENKGVRFFTIDEVLKLQELSGTFLAAEYFGKGADCIYLPKLEEGLGKLDLADIGMDINIKRGDLEAILKRASKDGVIDEKERKEGYAALKDLVMTRILYFFAYVTLFSDDENKKG